jgi:hypothetical protein
MTLLMNPSQGKSPERHHLEKSDCTKIHKILKIPRQERYFHFRDTQRGEEFPMDKVFTHPTIVHGVDFFFARILMYTHILEGRSGINIELDERNSREVLR